jgi:hypothetical protein
MITRLEHGQGPTRLIELRLARPPVNALDPALISALRAALGQAQGEGAADAGWADLRKELTAGPFVDMQKFFIGEAAAG